MTSPAAPAFKNIDPKAYFEANKDRAATFIKDVTVQARLAVPGEKIVTVMKDGHVETENVAKDDDVIIRNPGGEEYIVARTKFASRYEGADGLATEYGAFKAAGKPVDCVRLTEDVQFKAPWGEDMFIKKGGVIVAGGPNDYYGIQDAEFAETYSRCVNGKTWCKQILPDVAPGNQIEAQRHIIQGQINQNNFQFDGDPAAVAPFEAHLRDLDALQTLQPMTLQQIQAVGRGLRTGNVAEVKFLTVGSAVAERLDGMQSAKLDRLAAVSNGLEHRNTINGAEPETLRVACRDVLRDVVANEPELRDKLGVKPTLEVKDGYPADKLLLTRAALLPVAEQTALMTRVEGRIAEVAAGVEPTAPEGLKR